MRILIVEDNEDVGALIENILKVQYRTLRAKSGIEALTILESQPGVRVVVCDIKMPEMNGFELYARVKKSPPLRDIPFIFCSALADAESVRKAAQLGCKYYLLKPIQSHLLLAKVAEVFAVTPPILAEPQSILAKLRLDQKSYDNMLHSFHDLLKQQHAILSEGDSSGAKQTLARLTTLTEVASAIGAQPLLNAARPALEVVKKGGTLDLHRESVLIEIQKLIRLISYKESMASATENPKEAEAAA